MAAERTTIELQKISEFVSQLDGLVDITSAIVYGVDADGNSVKLTVRQLTDHAAIESRLTTVETKAETNRTSIATINAALQGKSNTGHTHAISDVMDLQTALNGKSDTGHTHAIGDVAGLRGELDNKAPLNHTHTIPQIEQLQTQINTITSNVTDIQVEVDAMGVAFGLPLVDDLTTYDAEVGKIVKYVGTTTSSYTHGYDYEKTSDGWVLSNSQPDNTSELSDRITTNANNITTINNKIGEPSGLAELDQNGKVPQSQLPSFVDDVEEYSSLSNFPTTGESGKIYIATDTNITYRWGGSTYVPIGSDLALGETASTAYRGDRGKTAYDHSQTQGNPHNTTIAQISGLQDALNGKQPTIGKNEFLKQVSDLDNYNAQNGEIVEYIGQTNSKYKYGLTYKYIQGETIEVPRGYYYINLDNNHILVSSGETATGIAQYMNVINKNGSYYTFFCKQSLSGNTPTDWNAIVQQELVNKLLVMKSDSRVKSWIKVVSITGEQISDYTWKFSTLTLEDGMVINREDITATSGSVASDILIDLNDSNSPDYYAIPDTPPIVSPTVINGCLFPTMQCGVGFNGSQKWASSEIEIDTSEWQHIKTTDTSTIESNIAALQTDKANEVTSFTEAATRANIASGDTVTTIWGKIKKWFTDLKAVAWSGSYNDLKNKPLSVENSKVKYTLSDGTTKLTLAQESDVKDIGIDFTSSTVSGNIESGETLAVMMKKIYNICGQAKYRYFGIYNTQNGSLITELKRIKSLGYTNGLIYVAGEVGIAGSPYNSTCIVEFFTYNSWTDAMMLRAMKSGSSFESKVGYLWLNTNNEPTWGYENTGTVTYQVASGLTYNNVVCRLVAGAVIFQFYRLRNINGDMPDFEELFTLSGISASTYSYGTITDCDTGKSNTLYFVHTNNKIQCRGGITQAHDYTGHIVINID